MFGLTFLAGVHFSRLSQVPKVSVVILDFQKALKPSPIALVLSLSPRTTMHSIKIPQLLLMAIILVFIIKAIDFGISSLVFNALFTLDGSKFQFEFGFVLIFSGQLI
jgi:hypothetical protein